MQTQDALKRLFTLQATLVDKMGRQPYFELDLRIFLRDDRPYCVSWHGINIHDPHTFYSETAADALRLAEDYVEAMPDAETAALHQFHKDLSKVIDEAPPQIDTKPLSEFNANIHKNLLAAPV